MVHTRLVILLPVGFVGCLGRALPRHPLEQGVAGQHGHGEVLVFLPTFPRDPSAAIHHDIILHAYVLEKLAEHVDQAGGPALPLVHIEPVAEPVHNDTKVLAMQSEIISADVLEKECWDDWLDWGHVLLAGGDSVAGAAAYPGVPDVVGHAWPED
jgi:hypothetical protein